MAKSKSNVTRADGRISVQVYLGKVDGKRKYKTVYGKTQKEADEKALQVKLSLRKGIDIKADRDSLDTWAQRWLKTKVKDISSGRYLSYKHRVEMLEALKDVPVSKIRTSDLQDFINELAEENPSTGKPAAKSTLNDFKGMLHQIFSLAVENRVMEFNPAEYIKIPKYAPSQTRRALEDYEQQWILDTPHRAQMGAMIMMYAGLRRGELIPLTWGDIDLDNSTIDVNKSVEMVGGKSKQKDTAKTPTSIRTIDLPQKLVDFLKGKKPKDAADETLVVTSTKGQMLTSIGWQRMWESYWSLLNLKYGDFEEYKNSHPEIDFEKPKSVHNPHKLPPMIPSITAHWLRHTFITLMYLAGVDVVTAMHQAGHADIRTTLSIYTHLDKKYKRNSMNKVNDFLNKKQ